MKIKLTSIFFIWQGISILIDSISNISNNSFFKYWTYELPGLFNYISIIIGLVSIICGIGILINNKPLYKLSIGFSIAFLIYVIINSLIILLNGINIADLIFPIIYIIVYLLIIKSLKEDMKVYSLN